MPPFTIHECIQTLSTTYPLGFVEGVGYNPGDIIVGQENKCSEKKLWLTLKKYTVLKDKAKSFV